MADDERTVPASGEVDAPAQTIGERIAADAATSDAAEGPSPAAVVANARGVAHVRRSPRYGIFVALGVALGVIAAFVLTFAFGAESVDWALQQTGKATTYSTGQVFGFTLLGTVPAGIAVMVLIAALLDRVIGRRTREVAIEREIVRTEN